MNEITALVEIKNSLEEDPLVIDAMQLISTISLTKILTIKDDDQEHWVTEMLVQAKQIDRKLEEHRKIIVDPFNKRVKAINGFFSTLAAPIKAKVVEIENAIRKWRIHKAEEERKAQERAQREMARIQTRFEKQGMEAPPIQIVAPKVDKTVRTQSGAAFERGTWQVEVEDVKALARAVADGQVVETVLKPDMTALRGLIRAGIRKIPGCKVYQSISIATRGM